MMERVWGGDRLARLLGKATGAGRVIGESWELSDRPEAESEIVGEPFHGKTLRTLIQKSPREIMGGLAGPELKRFPLLLKYVDAAAPLSIQVHPDDEAARPFGDRGKSECWVILHAEARARIVRGFRRGVTRKDYERAVTQGRVAEILHSFTPRSGDVIALPAGMVHAIGAGVLVAEIQQNSDLTFRIHDYGRLGLDGKPRKLHLEEALGAIRFDDPGSEFSGDMSTDTVQPHSTTEHRGVRVEELVDGIYFNLSRYTLSANCDTELQPCPEAPRALMAIHGSGAISGRALKAGDTALIPAASPALDLSSDAEGLIVLLSQPKKP